MSGYVLDTEAGQILNGGAERNGAGDVRRAGLKFVRELVVEGLLKRDRTDHVTAALVGRHSIEQGGFAVQNADARRCVQLVAGESIEVTIERLHVHRHMWHSLGAIDQHWNVQPVRHFDEQLERNDRAQRIGNVRHRDELCPRSQQFCKFVKPQLAVVAERSDAQPCLLLTAEDLPGHDVRVVLHAGNQHFIARAYLSAPIGLRNEVDGLCRPANKNNLRLARGVEETLYRPARRFVLFRRIFGKVMHAPVNVGISPLVVTRERIDDDLRLLRRGSVVQIDERFATYGLLEDRKVTPGFLYIEPMLRRARLGGGGLARELLGSGRHPTSSTSRPRAGPRDSRARAGKDSARWNRCWLISPSACPRAGPGCIRRG